MRVWTVHTPPEAAGRGRSAGVEARLGLPVLVPEGFSWTAFLFGLPWLLWHRLWLAAVIYLAGAATLAAGLPLAGLPAAAAPVAVLTWQLLLGFHAQDLRRAALARRRFAATQVVAERDVDRALARVLDARLLDARPAPPAPGPMPGIPVRMRAA
ncbi:DUF2628 domain-containing protein [Paeniroseomonas aquatica]|uniref:DUF2628 domain-containing protein n=1 Tax=Paeniroseomonas aquatica TaxID=373043 RepID=A0ABT8AB22_9PROT|nr:DUF2628 domain-containing protein [Paeniroseomonas aquatica]MDN3566801.1 DUF2628 domain-containing protein [Paeniroseomonas aquatica]